VKRLRAASVLCCVFFVLPCYADDPADGFLLIRMTEADNEAVANLDLTNVDTGAVVEIRSNKCSKGGVSSRICLVPATAGRYFWTRFEMIFRLRGARSAVEAPGIRRTSPGSSEDSVEIVAGAISYIGDWRLDDGDVWNSHSHQRRYSVDIRQNFEALQQFYEHFPDEAANYEIYLSMLGKEAISLRDFLKLVERESE